MKDKRGDDKMENMVMSLIPIVERLNQEWKDEPFYSTNLDILEAEALLLDSYLEEILMGEVTIKGLIKSDYEENKESYFAILVEWEADFNEDLSQGSTFEEVVRAAILRFETLRAFSEELTRGRVEIEYGKDEFGDSIWTIVDK